LKSPRTVDHREFVETFMITSTSDMKSLGNLLLGCSDFNAEYPPASLPGDNATVWDLAYFYCMVECHKAQNESERKMMDALANSEFINITECIPIEYWDGKDWEELFVFDYDHLNDLARNAQFYAHKLGLITIPHGEKRFTVKQLSNNPRIDFYLDFNQREVNKGDIF